ncbi:MAG: DUF2284 domain-containing protein [Sedimentisphaeraceae bacterium JB056]
MLNLNRLTDKAKELGAKAASPVEISKIRFSEEFRQLCEQNSCGNYGKNWMCPPAVGTYEETTTKVMKYSDGVVFQTVYNLTDSFDFEGMTKAKDVHDEIFMNILDYVRSNTDEDFLALNVGNCKVCKECAYSEGKECRHPDRSFSSVEAHCIDVKDLLTTYGIPYINGVNTVSYVGLFLFKD